MGKLRNKSSSEVEHLRGELRSLKSENKSLRQRLKQLEKREHFFENPIIEKEEPIKKLEICTSCGKGNLKYVDLGRVIYQVCPVCDDRKKI